MINNWCFTCMIHLYSTYDVYFLNILNLHSFSLIKYVWRHCSSKYSNLHLMKWTFSCKRWLFSLTKIAAASLVYKINLPQKIYYQTMIYRLLYIEHLPWKSANFRLKKNVRNIWACFCECTYTEAVVLRANLRMSFTSNKNGENLNTSLFTHHKITVNEKELAMAIPYCY